jgi:hypothetical protein
MKNIKDSMLFLLITRKTISDLIVSESNLNPSDKVLAKNFIMNEATDYEIMSVLMESQLPNEQYNDIKEDKLFESLKKCILINEKVLSKYIPKETIQCVLEIDSVSQYGFSSSIPIMEYMIEQYQADMSDDDYRHSGGSNVVGKAGEAGMTALIMRPRGGYKRAFTRYKNRKLPKQIAAAKALPAKTMNFLRTGRQAAMNGISSVVNFAKSGPGKVLGIVAIVALVALAANKIYREKLSQAAKACSKYTGPEKQNCMRGFKRTALSAQIAQLKAGLAACKGTNNPEGCQNKIAKKVASLQRKISKI